MGILMMAGMSCWKNQFEKRSRIVASKEIEKTIIDKKLIVFFIYF